MRARAVEENAELLRALKRDVAGLASLTVISFAAALALHGNRSLALPLLFAGLAGAALGIRAAWRHWDVVDRLLQEPDAYTIDEVRRRADGIAASGSRRVMAAALRRRGKNPDTLPIRDELAELASELEDDGLTLDPICAVICKHLIDDDLYGQPAADAAAHIRRVRSGFTPAR